MKRKAAAKALKKSRAEMYDLTVEYAVRNAAEWIEGVDPETGEMHRKRLSR